MTTIHTYEPWGGCREAFISRRPEVLLSGPAGTGKSRALLERLLVVALKYPHMRGLIVRKTLSSLGSTALVTWRDHVAATAIKTGVMHFYGGSAEEPPQYRFANGSRIMVGGMDKATRIMSSEYDLVYVQEAIELTVTDWEAITTRLRNGRMPYQQVIADTNPDTPTHWLKQRADRGVVHLIESRHEDNPVLFHRDGTLTDFGRSYIGILDNLTGVRYKRLRKGLWVAAEGTIFEDWDPAIHLVNRFTVPPDWPRYWAVDFGFVHPFVWQNWAIDPDGVAYLTEQISMTGRTVDQHAKTILDTVAPIDARTGQRVWRQRRPTAVLCDHDAENRTVLGRELGMSTTPAHKAVLEGIQAVQKRLRPRGDGRRGLYVMRDALVERDPTLDDEKKPTNLAEEIVGYVWDTGGGKAAKEAPLKIDDDNCDTMRYLVAQLDLGGRPGIRVMQ